MATKELFLKLITSKGYSTLYDFCLKNGIDYSNTNKRLTGRQKIAIDWMFNLANILHEPIEVIIEIFYPDEYQENRALIKEVKE